MTVEPPDPVHVRAICRHREKPGVARPSLVTHVVSAAGAAVRVAQATVAGLPVLATAEEYERRMAICQACPEFDASTIRCKKCTCWLQAKARLETEKGFCPLGKW